MAERRMRDGLDHGYDDLPFATDSAVLDRRFVDQALDRRDRQEARTEGGDPVAGFRNGLLVSAALWACIALAVRAVMA